MVRTGKQATKSMKKIRRKTNWSFRKIGSILGCSYATAFNIHEGNTKNPGDELMEAIAELEAEIDQW